MTMYNKNGYERSIRIAKDLTYATNGKGRWPCRAKDVEILGIVTSLRPVPIASLIVYIENWYPLCGLNPSRSGVIFSDPQFLEELRASLKEAGYLHTDSIEYSTIELQGFDFVHFDVDPLFFLENF